MVKRWLGCVMVIALPVHAEIGVSALAAYRFGDELAVQDDTVSVEEGRSTALTLHYFSAADAAFDLWLSRHDTEALTGTVTTDLRQDAIQFGGRRYWRDEPFFPYVGATIGVLRLQPSLRRAETETRPAFSLFAGLALPLSEQTQLVAEARWLSTFFSGETRLRCDDSDCQWTIQSGSWTQYDVGLGLTVVF